MMNIGVTVKKSLPNFVTILSLLSGSIATVLAFQDNLIAAACFIFAAAVFDFMDGMVARALKAYSPMGKELDSLSDVISFGMAPAAILFRILLMSLVKRDSSFNYETADALHLVILFSPFLITAFSALRLAKFNIDERQTSSFIGLPTPASAIFIASLALILIGKTDSFLHSVILNLGVLLGIIVVLCALLVAEIPMFSLKIKSLRFADNRLRYFFLLIAVLALIFFNLYAIPFVIIFYVILSIINDIFLSHVK
ncbi:MAG: CDP-diacylglycerol--serine O-phosphatidyltransferase [Bacteroidota bacterium]|nr:CDP-diacylglycerol--serine O-phosphatidyltransferase [Bacteroidota bacterium]